MDWSPNHTALQMRIQTDQLTSLALAFLFIKYAQWTLLSISSSHCQNQHKDETM